MSNNTLVEPGSRVKLSDYDPSDTHGASHDAATEKVMQDDLAKLTELQELLYVASANSVLVVLQGMDTSGKDGTVRHVFCGVSPLGSSVAAFKAPTPEELAHDYLWRIHHECPPKGNLTIFNRSHYESVLVELVHGIINKDRCKQRYDEINSFEKLLVREGTIVIKFMLHISKDEQQKRLLQRLDTPEKQWKVSPGDWQERLRWKDYQAAYEDALSHTSTGDAPWCIVPSDHKWYRNLIVAKRLIAVLEPYRTDWEKARKARGREQLAEMKAWEAEQKSGAGTKRTGRE